MSTDGSSSRGSTRPSSGHGLCAGGQRWVRKLGEGPLSGTLHPNEEGHRQIAALISPELAGVLNP